MKVKTMRRHGYDKRIRVPGEVYEIKNPKHVQILEAVKKIERVPEKVQAPKPEKKKAPKPKTKRQYKRRDMTAEKGKSTLNKVVKDAELFNNDNEA